MRWDAVFADLEGQADALAAADRAVEASDRARIEVLGLRLSDRMRLSLGSPVRIRLAGDLALAGRLAHVGTDWLLLDEGAGREAVVALRAVVSVGGLSRYSASAKATGAVESRLGLASALRRVAQDRTPVAVHLLDGGAMDGTIDRVGADFVEVATHAPGEWRRAVAVSAVQIVALGALAAVRRTV